MPFINYQDKRFSADSLLVIQQANAIIREYQAQGFTLTLRQLYYQFVARDMLPNTMRSYKRLGSIVNDARMAGQVDWDSIEDRTRNLEAPTWWNGPSDIVQACAQQFNVDRWANQEHRPEVWIEKEALVGVIADACEELRVPYFACRGYVSQSEQWRAGRRHRRHLDRGQYPVVFHLGDHDPSGIDMTRDNRDRLFTFAEDGVEVERLALNMDQVDEHQPPPNPAKVTDSRFESYVAQYGGESWELDALEPRMLVQLVKDAVLERRDEDAWEESGRLEQQGRERLQDVADELAEED